MILKTLKNVREANVTDIILNAVWKRATYLVTHCKYYVAPGVFTLKMDASKHQ